MTLKEAQRKMGIARKKKKKIIDEISMLRDVIISYGVDPNPAVEESKIRRQKIIRSYKKGIAFKKIAESVGVSAERVRQICYRYKRQMEMKKITPVYSYQ